MRKIYISVCMLINQTCKARACERTQKGVGYLRIMIAWLPKLKGWLWRFLGKRLLQKMLQATSNRLDTEMVPNAQRWVHALTTAWPYAAIRPKCAEAVAFISVGRNPGMVPDWSFSTLLSPLKWGNHDSLPHCCTDVPLSIRETQKSHSVRLKKDTYQAQLKLN